MQGHLAGHPTQLSESARPCSPRGRGKGRGAAPAVLCKTLQWLCYLAVLHHISLYSVSHIKGSLSPTESQRQGEDPISSLCLVEAHGTPQDQLLPPDFPHLFLPSLGARQLDQSCTHISASESRYLLFSQPMMPFPCPSAPPPPGSSPCMTLPQPHTLTSDSSESLSSSFQI